MNRHRERPGAASVRPDSTTLSDDEDTSPTVGEFASRLTDLPGERTSRDAAVIFLAALLLRLDQWFTWGPRVVRDGHRYVEWCSSLSVETVFGSRALLYTGYWIPYCGWLKATGGYVDGWVALQVVLSAVTCVFVYQAGSAFVGRWTGVVAGGAFVFQYEVYRWVTRAQSEFAMAFVFALALWQLARYHESPSRRNRLLALGALGWVAITRPNGLPIVAGYFAYDLFPSSSERRLDLTFSAPVNFGVLGTTVALMAYRLQFGWAEGSALAHWKLGTVITPDRLVYEYTPRPGEGLAFFVANAEHVVSIAVLRAVWFFSPVMPGFSTRHAVIATLSLGPLLVGTVLGIRTALARDRRLLVFWGTPLAMLVLTSVATWVPGWRNFLGPAAVVYALFTGYYVSETGWPQRLAQYSPL